MLNSKPEKKAAKSDMEDLSFAPANSIEDKLIKIIPKREYIKVMSQRECEYEPDFMGFLNIYEPLSKLIPREKIVIDFGSYLATQSYLFTEHKAYISVDLTRLKRFSPDNAKHYVMSIQEFIKTEYPRLLSGHNENDFFAICSYVPDNEATEMVRKTFRNVCCYYP